MASYFALLSGFGRPEPEPEAAVCLACGGDGCGLCRAQEQAQPLSGPRSPRGGGGDELAACQAGESRAVALAAPSGAWSLQRRAAVLAVCSALLAGTLWCAVSLAPSHGAPEKGSRGAKPPRSLEAPAVHAAGGSAAGQGAVSPSHDPSRRHELLHSPLGKPHAVENHSGPLHNNLSRNRSSKHQNLSHNRSGKHHEVKPKPKNITARVENITKRDGWVLHHKKNCYFRHGSGRFPDGSKGDTNGTITDLDDCMLACAANKWCDGIVVDAGKTNGSCSLRSEMVFTECVNDTAFNTWLRGSIAGRVKRLADSNGWKRYEKKNCYVGHGSADYPSGITPYSTSEGEAIPLSDCMQRCQEDPFCEAIVTSHGHNVSACELRAWVAPDDCLPSKDLDLWRMGQGRKVPRGIKLPSGQRGLDRLVGVADMITQKRFGKLNFTSCALVGESGAMLGSNAGEDIDGHTAVIRLDRMPTPEFHGDFGARTDVLYLSKEWSGAVALMGGEKSTGKCKEVPGCNETAVLTRGDLDRCDPDHMAHKWGPTHPLVGCTHTNVSRMVATGFSTLRGLMTTAGLHALFTFLPVCGELDLYGLRGQYGPDHNLEEERKIQDIVINRRWDDLPWRSTFKEFDWIMDHAAQARQVVGKKA